MESNRKITLLVAFGTYLLSPERRENYKSVSEDALDQRLATVNDADIRNFFELESKKDQSVTIGQKRVARNFNPTANQVVEELKSEYAELIDYLEAMKAEGKDGRCLSIAQTDLETSCMYAVKSLFA